MAGGPAQRVRREGEGGPGPPAGATAHPGVLRPYLEVHQMGRKDRPAAAGNDEGAHGAGRGG
eukprot:11220911-Lingulodinium_polyedra.AAC.1